MDQSPPRNTSVTVADVAQKAGVSKATAARVLGGYGTVSDRVREAVTAAARALDYRPNELARSMTTAKAWDSCRWPGVTQTANTMPLPSQTRWSLVPKPPCERPSAWSCGSCSCIDSGPCNCGGRAGFFFRPGRGARGADDGGIDQPQVAGDEAGLIEAQQ